MLEAPPSARGETQLTLKRLTLKQNDPSGALWGKSARSSRSFRVAATMRDASVPVERRPERRARTSTSTNSAAAACWHDPSVSPTAGEESEDRLQRFSDRTRLDKTDCRLIFALVVPETKQCKVGNQVARELQKRTALNAGAAI